MLFLLEATLRSSLYKYWRMQPSMLVTAELNVDTDMSKWKLLFLRTRWTHVVVPLLSTVVSMLYEKRVRVEIIIGRREL